MLALQLSDVDSRVYQTERTYEQLHRTAAVYVDLVVGDDEHDSPPPEVQNILVYDNLLCLGLDPIKGLRIQNLRKRDPCVLQQDMPKIDRWRVLEA